MCVCSRFDLERIEGIFAQLDKDGNGQLEMDDVMDLVAKQKKRRELLQVRRLFSQTPHRSCS